MLFGEQGVMRQSSLETLKRTLLLLLTHDGSPSEEYRVLGFTDGAVLLVCGAGLLHGCQGPFLVGIIEPSPFPEILVHMGRGDLGTAVPVQGSTVIRSRNMYPVDHGRWKA